MYVILQIHWLGRWQATYVVADVVAIGLCWQILCHIQCIWQMLFQIVADGIPPWLMLW